jgi:hypothetical protein
LDLQIQTVHVPGVINVVADALSRLDRSGDYQINPDLAYLLFNWWDITPTLDLFANQYNRILPRYVSTDPNDTESIWTGAFNHTWKSEILWIHPPISTIP